MKSILLFSILFLGFSAFSQSDDCAGATTINVNAACVTTNFNNDENGTADAAVTGSCAIGSNYSDVWYTVVGVGLPVTITLSGGNRDAALVAFSSCGGPQISCTMITSGATGNIVFPTVSGTNYFIQIQRRSGSNTNDMNANICATAAFPTPANDLPCNATSIAAGNSCVNTTGTTLGATYLNNAANGGTPSCASPGAGDVWYTITTTTAGNYAISTSAAASNSLNDSGMSIYSGPCTAPVQIACDDDSGPGSYSLLNLPLLASTTYYIRVWKFNSGGGNFNICAQLVVPPTNTTCASPNPICSGSAINFIANTGLPAASVTNPGNAYGCLSTSPNPSWYYLKIASSGTMAVDITAGSDVDFALYGPFTSVANAQVNCNTYTAPIDCSYSGSATEQANALVSAGQIYVLLVTNYANTVQNISVSTAGANTATTDCAIVALGVDFGNVTAVKAADGANVYWSTYSENNAQRFEVMHSQDGANWEKIGTVDASDNSSEIINYGFKHKRVANGNNYYKLVEFDIDQSSIESEVAHLYRNFDVLTIFPNPSNGSFNIAIDKEIQKINVIDLSGNIVFSQSPENNTAHLDVNHLRKGSYLVEVQTASDRIVQRIVIE
jgi:Secretion system C-terminal sorting domain